MSIVVFNYSNSIFNYEDTVLMVDISHSMILYGEDRMIKLDVNDGFHWEGLVNHQATDIRIDDVGTRGEVYMQLRDNDYEQLRPIVEKMHREIVAKSKN